MGTDLLLYCPLNESRVNSGGIATNWGSLGFADNGTYEGSSTPRSQGRPT